MGLHKVNTPARMTFALLGDDRVLVGGELQADFDTPTLIEDGAISATPVTIVEVQSGIYEASFTPTTTGEWYLFVQHTATGLAYDAGWTVTATGADVPTPSEIVAAAGADGDSLIEMVTALYDVVVVGDSENFNAGQASPGVVFKKKDGSGSRVTCNLDAHGNRTGAVVDHT